MSGRPAVRITFLTTVVQVPAMAAKSRDAGDHENPLRHGEPFGYSRRKTAGCLCIDRCWLILCFRESSDLGLAFPPSHSFSGDRLQVAMLKLFHGRIG